MSDEHITEEVEVVTFEYDDTPPVEVVQPEPSPEPVSIADKIFIHNMIKSVILGEWGDDQDVARNLEEFGFTQDQVFALLVAVDERKAKS